MTERMDFSDKELIAGFTNFVNMFKCMEKTQAYFEDKQKIFLKTQTELPIMKNTISVMKIKRIKAFLDP